MLNSVGVCGYTECRCGFGFNLAVLSELFVLADCGVSVVLGVSDFVFLFGTGFWRFADWCT